MTMRTACPRPLGTVLLRTALVWLAVLGCASCAAFPKRVPLSRFQGQMLRSSDAAGIDCLAALKEGVEPVKLWIIREGEPDYVLVESRRNIVLFYIDRDELVRFQKPLIGGRLVGTPKKKILSDHYTEFRNSDRERLVRVRAGDPPKPEPRREEVRRKRVGADENGSSTMQGDRPQ